MAYDRGGDEVEEIVVKVKRCAKVVKGGKRFSFNALVVVGNRRGRVGWGYGKANEVPFAVEKAIQEGKKNLIDVPIVLRTVAQFEKQRGIPVVERKNKAPLGPVGAAPPQA